MTRQFHYVVYFDEEDNCWCADRDIYLNADEPIYETDEEDWRGINWEDQEEVDTEYQLLQDLRSKLNS